MTDRELQLTATLETELQTLKSIEKSIESKQKKLKACKQKIVDLKLAIKEEQLNSIRESIDKNGFDFEAFREALEMGQLKTALPINGKISKEKIADEKSENERENEV